MNPAIRKFINEMGSEINILVRAGPAGRNVTCRTVLRGPSSLATSNMTRMELEQLRDAINEALAG